jgi:hypothetical protein
VGVGVGEGLGGECHIDAESPIPPAIAYSPDELNATELIETSFSTRGQSASPGVDE